MLRASRVPRVPQISTTYPALGW